MPNRAEDGAYAVLFDLDGTFADTAGDMVAALNQLLQRHGRPSLPLQLARPHVSTGSRGMLAVGFDLSPGDADYEDLRTEFLDLYAQNICQHTKLFPGIAELIGQLEIRGNTWGIVTNKPGWLTQPLLAAMELNMELKLAPACVVSGDTAARAKPHPDPLLYACRLIDHRPDVCWYIGDDQRDILAGRSAGMSTLAAGYGYLGTESQPGDWGADGVIDHPLDVLNWLDARAQPR
ncbi:MAG TPA: phosphoglycolate phosphatase [Chromatiaceae bacterium]|jgi:2-phosphoglycolate phosphatase|nr:MAG: hypothetical protein N838_02395 [Thiohalocapsa sp. PB-PSB1]QQO54733.1 MAG: HAD-IA family hydrolase [Thiohalocapsa sp. PB-PSB1]HBG94976.1 phosphoglycolate phosphatase [Chromatiaceae bacterium]HCS90640.1 phosphoglycolate phosphatase [Chromatiaceae bacterium]